VTYSDVKIRRRITDVLVLSNAITVQPWALLNGVLKNVRAVLPVHGYRPTDANVDGTTGAETVETTRIDRLFIFPYKNVAVKKLVFYNTYFRCYVNTAVDTYHYRYYLQLCKARPVEAVGADTSGWNVESITGEKLLDEYSRGAEAAAGWYNYGRWVQRMFKDVYCPDWLVLRWRGTSWTEGGAVSGAGYGRLGSSDYMGVVLEVEVL